MDDRPEPSAGGGEGASPYLAIAGFSGTLDLLLVQARAHRIDLATLRLPDLIDQLADRLDQASAAVPLGQKADWVVMASWILLLRSDLLLPPSAPAQRAAEQHASALRDRLVGLADIQALAGWLDQRPQLGRDFFARGVAERIAATTGDPIEIDMIAFLWACLDLFADPAEAADTRPTYQIAALDLYSIPEARERILRLLATSDTALSLGQLLPEPSEEPAVSPPSNLRRRSAWTSTFVAGLELARQGDLVLTQENLFDPIIAQGIPEGQAAHS